MNRLPKYLIIIQARLGSTRFPNKVMQTVGGIPMVKRIWKAAKNTGYPTIVAWPERYFDLDENNVLERFRRIAKEFNPDFVIRITADCPLIQSIDILEAIDSIGPNGNYYSNYRDGHDVQIISVDHLMSDVFTHKEHVIADTVPTLDTGLSVNYKTDLERVRRIINGK